MFFELAIVFFLLLGAYYFLIWRHTNLDSNNEVSLYRFVSKNEQSVRLSLDGGSFVDKMIEKGRNVLIIYGSQTGTAEELASRLSRSCRRYGLNALTIDPEDVDISQLPRMSEIDKHLVVFLMATYGEGDSTDNAQEFVSWLTDTTEDMSGVNYTVFGLGNKTYEHYNAIGKLVDRRMHELGGCRLFRLGLGDDDDSLDDDYIMWKDEMLPEVQMKMDISSVDSSDRRLYKLLKCPFDIDISSVYFGQLSSIKLYRNQKPPFDAKNPYLAEVLTRRCLNTGGDRLFVHMELSIMNRQIRYHAGDHIAIYPCNNSSIVEEYESIFNHEDFDAFITLESVHSDSSKKHPFPCPTTYRTIFTHYLDITSLPKSFLLAELVEFTTDAQERDRLCMLSSSSEEGRHMYRETITRRSLTLWQLLRELVSCRPPLDYLCELLPRLQPRYYSISSSPKVHSDRIHITFVLVDYTASTGRRVKGVATDWLFGTHFQKSVGDDGGGMVSDWTWKVPCFVRRSQFKLPLRAQVPVILIGPGTGVAPFRGFIQERSHAIKLGRPVGRTILFYGCRHRLVDYLYREEFEAYKDEGIIELFTAFSRDQPQKVYVTHLIAEQSVMVWELLQQGAHVYVCGDAKRMASDVNARIVEVCCEQGGMTHEQATLHVKEMRSQRRYCEDVWS